MWKHVPEDFQQDDKLFAKYQADFVRETDVDFLKMSGDKYFGWPLPILRNIENTEELYKLEPLGNAHPFIRDQVERAKIVIDALKGECIGEQLVFCPLSYIRLSIGYPKMMKMIRENPEAMKYACNVVAEDVKLLVHGYLKEAGVDGIFYSVQNAEENRFTYEEYRDWVTPSDKAVLDYANTLSNLNMVHFCAWEQIPNRLSVWADYKAAAASWSRYIDIMDIGEAKKQFGIAVWGGFDNRKGTLLFTGSREEIEAEVKALVEQSGKKNFIIGADCSLDGSLSNERISWVVETARKL